MSSNAQVLMQKAGDLRAGRHLRVKQTVSMCWCACHIFVVCELQSTQIHVGMVACCLGASMCVLVGMVLDSIC